MLVAIVYIVNIINYDAWRFRLFRIFFRFFVYQTNYIFLALILRAIYSNDICTVKIKNISYLHAVLTNQIADTCILAIMTFTLNCINLLIYCWTLLLFQILVIAQWKAKLNYLLPAHLNHFSTLQFLCHFVSFLQNSLQQYPGHTKYFLKSSWFRCCSVLWNCAGTLLSCSSSPRIVVPPPF